MIKNFLKLFIFLLIVVSLFAFNIKNLVSLILFANPLETIQKESTMGPFAYLKREFDNKPQSEWPTIVNHLRPHFPHPLDLLTIDELELDADQKDYLLDNNMLLTGGDAMSNTTPEIWYTRFENTNLVLRIYMSPPIADKIDNKIKWIYYIMIKKIVEHPESDWPQFTDRYEQQYSNSVDIVAIKDLTLTAKQFELLNQGKIVANNFDTVDQIFYKRIKQSQFVLEVEPFGAKHYGNTQLIVSNIIYIIIVILALLIALTLYLWMRPIWRDLNKLNYVTTLFGQGNFDSRSHLSKKSAIWNLSEAFNNMASRISKLITSHKDLTNAVSHELRTPLSRLRFAIEMLNEEHDKNLQQEYVDSMVTDIAELELLVSELLSYARFDRENPELKYCELDLVKWLDALIDKINKENITKQLQLINQNSSNPVFINIDPKLIERALSNIIRNAIRYARNTIDIQIQVDTQFCTIIIEDDGPGIPKSDRQRILQPFTRLDYSRNRKTGGYGLGLSIVQQIVKWHNGEITILSSHYQGARFDIKLPLLPNTDD